MMVNVKAIYIPYHWFLSFMCSTDTPQALDAQRQQIQLRLS